MTHILIIDEQPDMGDMLQRLLRRAGYAASTAATLGQAAACVRRCRPSLVLLDLSSPCRAPAQMLERARTLLLDRSLPLIVMSTWEPIELELGAPRPGGYTDFIAKPFLASSLLERVERALRR